MNSNFNFLLVNYNIENIYPPEEDDIFLTETKVRRRNNAVLNNFSDLESESSKIIFDAIFLWIFPMMQFQSYRSKDNNK